MTKRKAVAALIANPQVVLIMGWKYLGAFAEERRYWREERRIEAERLSHWPQVSPRGVVVPAIRTAPGETPPTPFEAI